MSPNTPEVKKDDSGYIAFGIAIALGLLAMKNTIPLLLLLVGGVGLWRLWKGYQKKRQDQLTHLNGVFYRLIQENNGWITPLDLAMNSQVTAEDVQEYLNKKAMEFAAQFEVTEQGGIVYYFSTAQSLISGFEDEELLALSSGSENSAVSPVEPPEAPKKGEVSLFPVPFSAEVKVPNNLNQLELAKRLNVHQSTLSKWKTKPQFQEWSSQKDPDNITWNYSEKNKRFYPIFSSNIQSKGNPFLSQNNYKNRQIN